MAASREATLNTFLEVEGYLQARHPDMRYSELLARVHAELAARAHPEHTSTAADEEAHTAFGQSIGTWPVFPDTLDALARLSKHFKLMSGVTQMSYAPENVLPDSTCQSINLYTLIQR